MEGMQLQCQLHKLRYILSCKDCGGIPVCSDCIVLSHQHHGFDKIPVDKSIGITEFEEYVKGLEEIDLINIVSDIQSVDHQMVENEKNFQILADEIQAQGGKLKAQIDKITKTLTETCRKVKNENAVVLSHYKQDLQSFYNQLNERVKNGKQKIESGQDYIVMDEEFQIDINQPPAPQIQLVNFIEGQIPYSWLQDGLGFLSICQTFVETFDSQNVMLRNIQIPDTLSENTSEVKLEFKIPSYITSLEKSKPGHLFVSFCNDNCISEVDKKGKVKQIFELDSNIYGISMSSVTGNLWCCCWDTTIYEIIDKKPTTRFAVDSLPWSLCLTPDNTVVVGTEKKLTVYSTSGKVLHSTESPKKPMVVIPHHIAVCPTTHDIAVCKWDWSSLGLKGRSHVTILDSSLHTKHHFYGPHTSSLSASTCFCPNDAAYDSQGNLFIADFNAKSIQIIGLEGQFLKFLHTDQIHPVAITLIRDNMILVGFVDKTVKVIKFEL